MTNPVTGRFTLLAGAPSNPFTQTIVVATPANGTDQVVETSNKNYRGVVGLIFNLPWNWRSEVDYTWSRSIAKGRLGDAQTSAAAGTAVSAGMDAGVPFNIISDTGAYPLSFRQFLGAETIRSPLTLTFTDLALRIGGPIGISLPGVSLL